MKTLIGLMMLLLSPLTAKADCYNTDFSHRLECERFSLFGDVSQTAHFWGGIAVTTVGTLAFEKIGLKPIPAALSALALTMVLAAAKEAMIDGYTSRNGILSTWAGGIVGAASVTVLQW